jgi:hypothetical protein
MPKTNELASTAQQFLARVQLTGQEVPAYVAVMDWLESQAGDSHE